MNVLKNLLIFGIGRKLVGGVAGMGLALSFAGRLSAQCGSGCGEDDAIPIRFYAQTVTDGGAISATLDQVSGVTVTSPSSGLSLKNTGTGVFRALQDRIYEGSVTAESDVLPVGSNHPMVVIFYPENRCGLKLETRRKLSGDLSWSDWREQDYASLPITFSSSPSTFTMNFQIRLVEREDRSEETQPESEETEVDTGGGAASIPEDEQDVAPGGSGQPSPVNPSTFHSTAGLGLGLSGYSVGSVRLAGPLAGSLADVTKLEFSNPLKESGLDEVRVSGNLRQIFTSKDLIDVQVVGGGGVELKYYAPGEFGTTKVSDLYPVTGDAFKTVRYLPLAAVSGQHLGGVRTEVEGTRGVTFTKDVVSLSSDGQSFRILEENGLKVTDVESTFLWDSGFWHRLDLVTETRSGQLYARHQDTYRYLVRREGSPAEVVESYRFLLERATSFSESSAPLVTTYVPDSTFMGLVGHVIRPDGSWEKYTYYTGEEGSGVQYDWRGLVKEIFRPWNGSPASPDLAGSGNCEFTSIQYQTSRDRHEEESSRVTTVPTVAGAKPIRRWESGTPPLTVSTLNDLLQRAGLATSWFPHSGQIKARMGKTFASSGEFIGDSSYFYDYEPSDPPYTWHDRTFASLDATGSGTITGYQMGSFNPSTGEFTVDTTPATLDGTHIQSIEVNVAGQTLTENESTKVVTVTDLDHRVLRREMWIYIGDDEWSPATTTTYEYPTLWEDGSIREVIVEQDDRVVSRSYQTSATEMHRWDEQGIETVIVSDPIGRTVSVTQVGTTGQEDRVTSHAYSGRTTTTTRSGGSLSLTTSSTEDLMGRRILETDESGAVTVWTHPNGGRDTVEVGPGGVTRTATRNLDGEVVSVTGNAVVPQFHEREADGNGNLLSTVRSGTVNSPRYVTTVTDWAGRVLAEIRPSPTGSGEITETRSYHAGTDEVASVSSDAETATSSGVTLAVLLREVPSWAGSLRRRGYSIQGDPALVLDSEDPITEELHYYEFDATRWWQVSERRVYDWFNGLDLSTAMVTRTKHCLKGDLVATVTIQPSGEEVSVTTTFNRTTKTRTDTTDSNRSTLDAVAVNVNGLNVSATRHVSAVATQWFYDDLGRVVREVSPTGAVTRVGYRPDGKVEGSTDTYGASTRYDYYGPAHASAGRVSKITHPDGTTTTYSYTTTGQVAEVAGSAAYRTTYGYDAHGALETLGTWRTGAGADVTTWTYQAGTGLLTAKTDAEENSVTYTYHPSGRMARRTWARGVYTDYTWDAFGRLTLKNYSDSTPDVSFDLYDRADRPVNIKTSGVADEYLEYFHGVGILRERIHNSSTSMSPYLPGRGVAYQIDATGRMTTTVEIIPGGGSHRSIEYGYNATGLLHTVTDRSQVHTYGYQANTDQVASIHSSTGGTDWFRETHYRDATGRLLGNLAERVNGSSPVSTIARHGYQYDASGRRVSQRMLDGSKWEYGYNDRSEVTAATRKDPSGTAIDPLGATYTYDGIGNRLTANSAILGDRTYTANALNQYGTVGMGDSRTAIGRAPTTMTIEVNGTAATRLGELYHRSLTASNATVAVWQEVETEDSDGDPSVTSYFWYDPQSLSPGYDEDGNLVNDGRWVYTWDAENRLIQMETTTAATTAGHPYTKLVFHYDGEGRRLSRTVYRGGPTTHESTRRWLYDGWNPIVEYSATSESATSVTRMNTLTWGTDLSGSLQGAGGVGGLLAQIGVSGGEVYRASYDGNGNVVSWTKSDQATAEWRTEYDAFGNPTVTEGSSPSEHGFSTKIRDPYTGLSYYGYRYYDPVTGRWPSRDPIEERGGVNLYGFVGNDGINSVDVYGLALYAFDGTNNDKDDDLGVPGNDGGPTNVSILFDIYKKNKVYAYGVGTRWEGIMGSAFGLGGKQRTRSMMDALKDFYSQGDCVADIIGFSRGAAMARNFANQASAKYPKLNIRWIGIFDTVPSFGVPGNGKNLGYDYRIPENAKRAYHIVASQSQRGGEHRVNFPVHSIYENGTPPPGTNHAETFVNGAHSDIGGGYNLFDEKGERFYGQGFRSNIANYVLKMMHADGLGNDVPFGPIPEQYRDVSKNPNKWYVNDSVSDKVGMQGEPDGIRRSYGPNGNPLPHKWAYKPF